jgi:hypothetical protein
MGITESADQRWALLDDDKLAKRKRHKEKAVQRRSSFRSSKDVPVARRSELKRRKQKSVERDASLRTIGWSHLIFECIHLFVKRKRFTWFEQLTCSGSLVLPKEQSGKQTGNGNRFLLTSSCSVHHVNDLPSFETRSGARLLEREVSYRHSIASQQDIISEDDLVQPTPHRCANLQESSAITMSGPTNLSFVHKLFNSVPVIP